jgi:hypothetical protein
MEMLSEIRAVQPSLTVVLLLSTTSLALPFSLQGQGRPIAKPQVNSIRHDLAAFLAAPIDLPAFKRRKGPSNSGSFKAADWLYRPDKPGFFYRYFLFRTPRTYSEVERVEGFSLVVYKLGTNVGDYDDTNEMLVAIWCRLKDPDLGRANLVGTELSQIKARFGEPFAVIGDVWIYQHDARALSLHINGDAVDWYKYAPADK